MGQAIRPDKFFSSIPSFVDDTTIEQDGVTEEEKILAGLSESGGWKVLKEFIERVTSEMDNINILAISQGATFEEIGKNTMVISLAKGVIGKILKKVEDAKEACERPKEPTGK